jgi:hypothetical protein
MVAITTIIGIILGILIIGMYEEESNIVKSAVIGTILYLFLSVIVSTVLFLMEQYGVWRTAILSTGIELVCLIILTLKNKKITFQFKFKEYLIPIILSLIMLPFISDSFGFFGMGQDQGVYQTKAIDLLHGTTELQKDFEEYTSLESVELKEVYSAEIKSKLAGFDKYDSRKPTLSEENQLSDVSGIFHGIPTFPAFLALSAKIFGLAQMHLIQALFWILTMFVIFFIAENLKLKKGVTFTILLTYSLSPIVLWLVKSSLTEMFLTLIIVMYMYFLTDKREESKILSAIPILIFSLFHVTIFTMIPLFIMLYYILYFYTKDKKYLYASSISVISFFIGYNIMTILSPTYSFNNAGHLYRMSSKLITENNVRQVFLGVTILVVLVNIILPKLKMEKLIAKYSTIKVWNIIVKTITIVTFLIMGLKFMKEVQETGRILDVIRKNTMVGYCLITGIILFAVVILKLLFQTKILLDEKTSIVLVVCFIYTILIYSTFLRADIPFYYYYGRYLVPFMPVILLLGGICIKKSSKVILIGLNIFLMVFFIPYTAVVATQDDDTRMAYTMLTELSGYVKEGDAIIIAPTLMSRTFIPLKEMTGVAVYPDSKYRDMLIEEIKGKYENIYVLTLETYGYDDLFTIIYKNVNIRGEDFGNKIARYLPFPKGFDENEEEIILYRYNKVKTNYNFSEGIETPIQGFGPLEYERGFVWTYVKESYITGFLEAGKDYELVIDLGPAIPLGQLKKDSIEFEIYLNDICIDIIEIRQGVAIEQVILEVPGDYVQTKNTLKFVCETWSPMDYGLNDSRQLGIAIKSVEFR